MYLLSDIDLSLPLKNPVVIFSLVLFIILFAPLLLNRLKIPHIIGLILAGVIVGPYGLNLLLRDSSIVLFGTVGLLYIMFTAGLEIDLEEFRKNRVKSLVFGLYTFGVPMVLGTLTAYYLLQFSLASSLLLASMFASHTLLAYPIASKYGIARVRSVTLTIGGTIITDILALLVLAGVTGLTKGDVSTWFWIRLLLGTLGLGAIIFLVFPMVARWFFKNFSDHVSQYIFVLAMVFLGAFLAELAGLEAIIGAFLSGLTLNRFIPHSSALMNRIEFVGNAFFIPFFLISVGMLVDFSVLLKGWGAVTVATVMTVLAVLTKFIAAWLTQKTFSLQLLERKMIFGLSTARVGATLAVVLVGYNIIIGETAAGAPIRLLNEDVLNGTILMILVTCTISSFLVEKASQQMALQEENQALAHNSAEKILVSLEHVTNTADLVELGLTMQDKGSANPVHVLHIISDDSKGKGHPAEGKKLMQRAAMQAASSGRSLQQLTRHDASISNGIIYTVQEHGITDLLLGVSTNAAHAEVAGGTTEQVIRRITQTLYLYKAVQPLNTLQRMLVAVPPRAELEPGFGHWFNKLVSIAKEAGLALHFYGHPDSLKELQDLSRLHPFTISAGFSNFTDWEDFLAFSGELRPDDLFVVLTSRKNYPSYGPYLEKVPYYLSRYFKANSYLLVYPDQLEHGLNRENVEYVDSALAETFVEGVQGVGKVGRLIKGLISKKE